MILRIFLGLLLTGSAFGGLELRLVPTEARETRIAGEPVTVLVILKNSGDVEEEIGYDTKPVESRGFVLHVNELEYKSKAFFGFVNKQISRLLGRKKLQSGKVLDQTIDLNFLPLRHGKNIVWAEIDLTKDGIPDGPTWISNKLIFQILEPTGVDMKAFEAMDQYKMHIQEEIRTWITVYDLDRKMNIVQNYPDSTYTGWILARKSPGATLADFVNGKDFLDDMMKPVESRKRRGTVVQDDEGKNYPKTGDGRYYVKSAEEEAKEFIQHAEPYIMDHPNHIKAAKIYKRLSTAYMVLHQWQKAYDAGLKSINFVWDGEGLETYEGTCVLNEKRVLEEALKELETRGLAGKKL